MRVTDEMKSGIAKDRADWLVDAVATATQNRAFLRGEKECDEVACDAIRVCGEKAILVAFRKLAALAVEGTEAEPVAWRHRGPKGGWITTEEKQPWSEESLYTTPPAGIMEALEDWRPVAELPQDGDDTYLVTIEQTSKTASNKGARFVEKAWICPAENSGWLDPEGKDIEVAGWRVLSFKSWPEPDTALRGQS